MRTIWKFPLQIQDEQQIQIEDEAKILCVQVQHGVPNLWAIIDPHRIPKSRVILIRGTGHPLGEAGNYIGTFQIATGNLVFHVFDGGTRDE